MLVQKTLQVFFNPLIQIEFLVAAVLLQHQLDGDLAVLITRQFVVELGAVLGQDYEVALYDLDTEGYPVVAIAAGLAPTANANADYSWFDFAQDALQIGNFNELVGFSVLSKLYDFGGKTITLTADIDGSSKLEGQSLSAGGELNDYISATFRGSFERDGHSISNVTFEQGESGKYVITWVVGETVETEEYEYGETPTYKGETTRPDDNVYRYEFNGWDEEIVPVSADVTYTARWKKTLLKDLEEETDPPTDTATEPPAASDSSEAPADKAGCQSSFAFGALPALALLAAAPALLRGKSRAARNSKKRR